MMRKDLKGVYSKVKPELECIVNGPRIHINHARIEVPIVTAVGVDNYLLERFGEDCPEIEEEHRKECEFITMQSARITEITQRERLREYKPRVFYYDGDEIGIIRTFGFDPSKYQVANETEPIRERK